MTNGNPERRTAWLAGAALLWVCLVLAGYYVVHKPVSLIHVTSVGRAALDLAAAAAITCLAGGLGRRLFSAAELGPLERVAVQAAAGLGVLGLLWLAAGALGLYSGAAAWLLLTLGLIVLRKRCVNWLGDVHAVRQEWASAGRFGRILAIGSATLIIGQLQYALAPPTKWDALVYHLELPRRYLEAGQFTFVENNPFWGQPQLFEMLSTWAMALHRPETAAALGWCMAVVLLLGTLGCAARRTNATAGWIAVTSLVAGYSIRGMLAWAYVDGLAALFGLGALIALLQWSDDGRDSRRLACWAGVLVGFALSVKLTAGTLLPVLILFLALSGKDPAPKRWRLAIQSGLIALLVFTPWLAKNLVVTGNPLYPHFWPTPWAGPERLAFYTGSGGSLGWQTAWLPLAATWLGVEGAKGFQTDVGPLLILLALPGLLARRRHRDARLAAWWFMIGWLAIAVGDHLSPYLMQTRLYFVLLPALALAAAWGWEALRRVVVRQVRFSRVLAVLILLVLMLSLWQDAVSLARLSPASVLLGARQPDEYLDTALGWYAVAMRALEELPPEARPIFLWEPRALYAPPQALADTWIDRWYLDIRSAGQPQAVLQSWRQQGYTHLLLFSAGADFERIHRRELSQADWSALDELLSRLSLSADFGGAYLLYSLAEEQ